MYINKTEALALSKVLHQHTGAAFGLAVAGNQRSEFQLTLENLVSRLDECLIHGDGDDADNWIQKDDEDEEAADDDEDQEDPSGEGDEEDDADEGEEDEPEDRDGEDLGEDEEEGVGEHLDANYTVTGDELHDLKPIKTNKGTLEFEASDDYHVKHTIKHRVAVTAIVDGSLEHGVTYLQRTGKKLEIRDEKGSWHSYVVSAKLPKSWLTTLLDKELLEVEG